MRKSYSLDDNLLRGLGTPSDNILSRTFFSEAQLKYGSASKIPVLEPDDTIMRWIYVLYGFSSLAVFNCILSSLDFFIE